MRNEYLKNSYIVYTSLDEHSDINCIDNTGSKVNYNLFKQNMKGIKLTFPSVSSTINDPYFQIWNFIRYKTGIILARSIIAGGSYVNYSDILRPIPVFEIYDITLSANGKNIPEETFVDLINKLDFEFYPDQMDNQVGYIKKPQFWHNSFSFKYNNKVNKKQKEGKKIKDILDWKAECRDAIDKLLFYTFNKPTAKNGISICFTYNDFKHNDICNYYYGGVNINYIKYQLTHIET